VEEIESNSIFFGEMRRESGVATGVCEGQCVIDYRVNGQARA